MRYEYKVVGVAPATVEDTLKALGDEGWELASITGSTLYFKKAISNGVPTGVAKACANCKHFSVPQGVEKDMKAETPGWCDEWKLAMCVTGACERFALKDAIPGSRTPLPAGSVPDEESAWHWQARTEFGEKRVEAITSQVAGIRSPEHKHQVIVIVDKNGGIVRGKTNMVNGHEHKIAVMGTTEEADGHTHIWSPTSERPAGKSGTVSFAS